MKQQNKFIGVSFVSYKRVLVIIKVLLVLIFPLIIVSCEKKEAPAQKPVPVRTEKLELKPVEITTDYIATLISRKSVDIYPRVSGPIEKILVKDGDYVTEGTPLLVIEDSAQGAELAASKAGAVSTYKQIEQQKATLKYYLAQKESAESGLQLAKTDYDRYKALYEKGSATQSDYDDYTNKYNQAIADLKAADEQVKAQEMTLKVTESSYKQAYENTKQQNIVYGYYTLKAPFSGKLGYIPVKVGDYVTSQTSLTSITNNKLLEIQVAVDAAVKDHLKLGMKIQIVDMDNKEIGNGKIYLISPKVDFDTQTVLVNAFIDNSNGQFDAGEVVRANVVWQVADQITVPTESVMFLAGQSYVYVVGKDNTVTQTPIQINFIKDNRYSIKTGLKEGDNIVVSGVQKLRNGMSVVVQEKA